MESKKLEQAKDLKMLFERLLDKTDQKKDLTERMAEVTAKLDKLLGKEWREFGQPEGLEIAPVEEGGKSTPKDKDGCFFDKVRQVMLNEDMNVGDLVTRETLPVKKSKPKKSFKETVEVGVKVKTS